MAQLPLPILTRAVRALAERVLQPIAVLPQLHAGRARMSADDAQVDDVPGPDDGFGARAGVLGVLVVGDDGVHVEVEGALHLLHGRGE